MVFAYLLNTFTQYKLEIVRKQVIVNHLLPNSLEGPSYLNKKHINAIQ